MYTFADGVSIASSHLILVHGLGLCGASPIVRMNVYI